MVKKIAFGLLFSGIICGGAWFYLNYVCCVPIKAIVDNPRDYEGKTLTISGKVADRVSLVFLKYFKLQDKSGEIIVITSRTLPALGTTVRIKGKIVEAFTIGSEQLLVFIEEDGLKVSANSLIFLRHIMAFTARLL
jgi:hypothetical protein